MSDLRDRIAVTDAKYSIKSWLLQKKARALKAVNPNAPGHTYTVLDLTRSFNEALDSFRGTTASLQTVKDKVVIEYPEDAALISEMCNSLAKRLPEKNLVGYIEGPPSI